MDIVNTDYQIPSRAWREYMRAYRRACLEVDAIPEVREPVIFGLIKHRNYLTVIKARLRLEIMDLEDKIR